MSLTAEADAFNTVYLCHPADVMCDDWQAKGRW